MMRGVKSSSSDLFKTAASSSARVRMSPTDLTTLRIRSSSARAQRLDALSRLRERFSNADRPASPDFRSTAINVGLKASEQHK